MNMAKPEIDLENVTYFSISGFANGNYVVLFGTIYVLLLGSLHMVLL